MRHNEEESPDVVLARLYENEPRWVPHPKTGQHPMAVGLSAAHESRASYEARRVAWAQAVDRELKRKQEQEKKDAAV